MTEVYLIEECGGSWEDKWNRIHSAYFDLTEAEENMKRLELESKNRLAREHELGVHYENCNIFNEDDEREVDEFEECPICNERHELMIDIEEGRFYRLEKIEVK